MILAPDPDEVAELLTENFSTGNALTTWAHAVLNTVLYPLDPKPDWFDGLNQQLKQAQAPAEQWVVTDGPAVAAGFPQGLIDYANLFVPASKQLAGFVSGALANPGRTPDATQREEILQILSALAAEAARHRASAAGYQQSVTSFRDQVASIHDALDQEIQNASASLAADQNEIYDLNARISALQQKLGVTTLTAETAEKNAAKTGATIVLTLLSFVIMGAVTGGAAVPVMGLAGGILSAGTSIVSDVESDQQIINDLQAIGDLQTKLDAEKQQLAALQGILNNLRRLDEQNQAASGNTADLVHLWDDVAWQLAAATEVVQQPALDLGLVSALNNLPQAADAWLSVTTAATNVQQSQLLIAQPVTLTVPASSKG